MEPTQQNIRDLEFYLDKLQAMGICAEVRKSRDLYIPTNEMEDFYLLFAWNVKNPAVQNEIGSALCSNKKCLVVLSKILYNMAMGRDYSYIGDDIFALNNCHLEMNYKIKRKTLQSLGIIPK